jgi:hypothetical protein
MKGLVLCTAFSCLISVASARDLGQWGATDWSEREDLNLRPLVSQTSALTGLRHAPMPFP